MNVTKLKTIVMALCASVAVGTPAFAKGSLFPKGNFKGEFAGCYTSDNKPRKCTWAELAEIREEMEGDRKEYLNYQPKRKRPTGCVSIGPNVFIGPNVSIGPRCR